MSQVKRFLHRPEDLLSEMCGRIMVLTINRPEQCNAWTAALRDELTRRLIEADQDAAVDALVITGAGQNAFCAGQDLREISNESDGDHMQAWMQKYTSCMDAVRNFSKPLIAGVNGVAAGSGFQLMQFCDYAIAHAGARMGQTEVSSGIPSVFGTWLMWERIGSRAYELCLQGRLMEADEAKQLGFINEIVEPAQVLNAAVAAAIRLAKQPRLAFKISKAANRKLDHERYLSALKLAAEMHREAFDAGAPQKMIAEFFATRRLRKHR